MQHSGQSVLPNVRKLTAPGVPVLEICLQTGAPESLRSADADLPDVPQSTVLDEPQLTLDGDLREIATLADWLRRFSESNALDEDADFRLNLVLEELFTNSVRHGGCQGMGAAVCIRLRIEDREILAEYADRGQPFDPTDAPPPDLYAPLEQRSAGGLGVHFVRQTARRIEYHRVNGWNRITIRLAI